MTEQTNEEHLEWHKLIVTAVVDMDLFKDHAEIADYVGDQINQHPDILFAESVTHAYRVAPKRSRNDIS